MLQRNIPEIEMHTLKQQVGSDKKFLSAVFEDGGIIPHPFPAAIVDEPDAARQPVDKTELAET